MAFALAAYDARELHRWYVAAGLTEPWQAQLGEPPDERHIGYTIRSRPVRRRGPPGQVRTTRHNPTT